MMIKKYDILLVHFKGTVGAEKRGIRPCVVVQNNQANEFSDTTVVCPITTTLKNYPSMMMVRPSRMNQLKSVSCVDILHIRSIDKSRIIKKIGVLDDRYHDELSAKFAVSFDLDDIL